MYFLAMYDGALAQRAYLIGCQKTGEAIVVDPERDVDRYIQAAADAKLRITAITETHIHADFLSGSRELARRTGATVHLSDEGAPDWRYEWPEVRGDGGPFRIRLLHNGDCIDIGGVQLQAIHTPGHTPEHISFLVTDRGGGAGDPMGALTGDFIFVGDVGRPDLLETALGASGVSESCAEALFESVQSFLAQPDYLQIWPAHSAGSACGKALGAVPQSTLGYERRMNPALRAVEDRASFLRYALDGQPEPPLHFARMKMQNKAGPRVLGELPRPRRLKVEELRECVTLDTRPWADFREGHLQGSLWTPLDATFITLAGSYVPEDAAIALIVDEACAERAVRLLVRIGLDNIVGRIEPGDLASDEASASLMTVSEISASDAMRRVEDGAVRVLDVRRFTEHQAGRLPGALHIPHTRLADRLDEVACEDHWIVQCRSGVRSAAACALLLAKGRDVTNLEGGIVAWEQAGGAILR